MANPDTLWTQEKVNKLCNDIAKYCDEVLARKERKEPISIGEKHKTYKIIPPDYPSIQEFQIFYGYSNYIFEIEKKHASVSESLSRISKFQAMFIQRYGMNGDYNSAVAKMAAMNNRELSWKDKLNVDNNHSGSISDNLSIDINLKTEPELINAFKDKISHKMNRIENKG